MKESFNGITVEHAESFTSVLNLLKTSVPDLLFLDINLPGGNSTKMIEKIRLSYPDLKVLMFSAYDEEQYALRYIHAGANGFLNKHSSESEIINAVQSVMETGKYISATVKEKILENVLHKTPINPLESLSDREIEVAGLLAGGEGNLEIANQLNIQMTTLVLTKTGFLKS
ncbi:response regulator transcription factor [Flavobacterium lindanitolerans]|nr:response regulator transcription factor [Flavobacterium lindanitolerans]